MHSKKIIHRDLKPDNIMTQFKNNSEKIYLIDFGNSKIYKERKFQKKWKNFVGTQRYAAISTHFGLEIS